MLSLYITLKYFCSFSIILLNSHVQIKSSYFNSLYEFIRTSPNFYSPSNLSMHIYIYSTVRSIVEALIWAGLGLFPHIWSSFCFCFCFHLLNYLPAKLAGPFYCPEDLTLDCITFEVIYILIDIKHHITLTVPTALMASTKMSWSEMRSPPTAEITTSILCSFRTFSIKSRSSIEP